MIISLLLLYWNLSIRSKKESGNIVRTSAENFIGTLSFWGIWLFFLTEVLSVGNQISRNSLVISWIFYSLVQLFFLILFFSKRKVSCFSYIERCRNVIASRTRLDKCIMLAFALFGMMMIYFAVCVSPYNCDSMIYHLSRIINWSHNGSVAHYATDNWRSTSSMPFAEFIGLHIYVLSDGADTLLNLIQTFSYLSIIYLVYQLAKRIGCDKKGARFAAILYATTPIAFAEANTTQNDEVAALWLVAIVYILAGFVNEPQRLEWKRGNDAGLQLAELVLCIGLGYMTKPSFIPVLVVFIIWMLFRLIKGGKVPLVRIGQWTGATAAGSVMVIAPEVCRNLITYHAVSYYGVGQRQIVGTIKPNYLFINFLKNFFYNSPSRYWPNVYWRFEKLVYSLADLLNVDVNDWAIAETGVAYELPDVNYGCDTAVNFVMFAMVVLCILMYVCRKLCERCLRKTIGWGPDDFYRGKRGDNYWCAGYCLSAFIGCLVMMLIIRWEPYINRYMIGCFALLAPAISLEFSRSSAVFAHMAKTNENEKKIPGESNSVCESLLESVQARSLYIRGLMCGMVGIISAVEFSIMFDELRLTVSEKSRQTQIEQYFLTGQDKIDDYTCVVDLARESGYRTIGLKLEASSFEYPLIRMLEDFMCDYDFVNVESDTEYLEDDTFIPECIIYTGEVTEEMLSGTYTCHNIIYSTITKVSDVCWFIER